MHLLSQIPGYKSASQLARVMTETWTREHIFCPNCGSPISEYENNRAVADFYCGNCREEFELKSAKKNTVGNKIVDGAYHTMIARLGEAQNPNFYFLNYTPSYEVKNFIVIPKHFFTPSIIEKRPPLPETARRAGWVGCNILLTTIPESGKIYYIENGKQKSKQEVLDTWQKTIFLRETKNTEAKGWLLDIMNCIESLGKRDFSLDEMYDFTPRLQLLHPENNFVQDKIRQQLQVLRDKGYLEFVSRGRYRKL
ncbi:restriction endonuclease [Candidatus Gracilibacteria bacterium]|nr:restriction endonuclease [Candidatus Gracilibacteria bacterium]